MPIDPSKKENLKAIRSCIKHWMLDVRKPIKRGVGINTSPKGKLVWATQDKQPLKISSSYCQLCWLYDYECLDCFLSQVTGYACGIYNSPYNNFITNPCLVTVTDMVRALVYTYWAVMEE